MDMDKIKNLKENDELTINGNNMIVRQVVNEEGHLEILMQDEQDNFFAFVGHDDHGHFFSLEQHEDHFHPKEEIKIESLE